MKVTCVGGLQQEGWGSPACCRRHSNCSSRQHAPSQTAGSLVEHHHTTNSSAGRTARVTDRNIHMSAQPCPAWSQPAAAPGRMFDLTCLLLQADRWQPSPSKALQESSHLKEATTHRKDRWKYPNHCLRRHFFHCTNTHCGTILVDQPVFCRNLFERVSRRACRNQPRGYVQHLVLGLA